MSYAHELSRFVFASRHFYNTVTRHMLIDYYNSKCGKGLIVILKRY